MTNLSTSRLIGIALIAGGTLIGLIMIALMSTYVRAGTFSATVAALTVITAFILLVLPQIGLGGYLIWHSLQETAVFTPENSPPAP